MEIIKEANCMPCEFYQAGGKLLCLRVLRGQHMDIQVEGQALSISQEPSWRVAVLCKHSALSVVT